jgi:predicted nucleotidyltransferase
MREHLEEIHRLEVRRVGVFGSIARGVASEDSEVDVDVELDDAKRTYDNFFALHELLETFLGRRVELVTDDALTKTKAKIILVTIRFAFQVFDFQLAPITQLDRATAFQVRSDLFAIVDKGRFTQCLSGFSRCPCLFIVGQFLPEKPPSV